jgi:UrcA family protein
VKTLVRKIFKYILQVLMDLARRLQSCVQVAISAEWTRAWSPEPKLLVQEFTMIAFHKFALVSAITLCKAGLPAVCLAATPRADVSEVSVSTADLDLGTAQGVATLRHRIHAAAKTVCLDAFPSAGVSSEQVRMCRIEAAQHAMPAVQSAVRVAEAKQAVSVEAAVIPR